MLIEKQIAVGDVITLKLSSGEEIIARYDGETADHIKVEKPLALVAGGQSLGMMPWIFLGESSVIKINKFAVVAGPMLSKKDAAAQYLQGTTGIALA